MWKWAITEGHPHLPPTKKRGGKEKNVGSFAIQLMRYCVRQVMEAAQASTGLSSGGSALQNVNHIAHLSGALIGVALIWLISRVPSDASDQDLSTLKKKKDFP